MKRSFLLLPLLSLTSLDSASDSDPFGQGFLLSALVSIALGMIPLAIIVLLFKLVTGQMKSDPDKKDMSDSNFWVYIITSLITGMIIKSFIF